MLVKASKDHLAEVDEDYFEHFGAAMTIAGSLALASLACALHALVPAFCTRTASRCVTRVHSTMVRRGVAAAK